MSQLQQPTHDTTNRDVVRSTMVATGADLPSELIDWTVDYFARRGFDRKDHENYGDVGMSKRDLVVCSCVCKYWAQRCRPHIFRVLKLRCAADLAQLLAFLRSPLSTVERYLDNISVVTSGTWVPWVHLVGLQLLSRPRPPPLTPLSLEITLQRCTLPGKPHAPRSFSALLPGTLPHALLPLIEIMLLDLHFARLSDFARLISGMRLMRQITCRRLEFDERDVASLPRVARPRLAMHQFWIHASGDALPMLRWVAEQQLRRVGVDMQAVPVLCDILLAFATPADAPKFNDLHQSVSLKEGKDENELEFREDYKRRQRILRMQCGLHRDTDGKMELSFVGIWIRHPHILGVEEVQSWDWNALDDTVSTLPARPPIRILVQGTEIFKWLITALHGGGVWRVAHSRGMVHAQYTGAPKPVLLRDVLCVPAEQATENGAIHLDLGQRFEWLLCQTDDARAALIRRCWAQHK